VSAWDGGSVRVDIALAVRVHGLARGDLGQLIVGFFALHMLVPSRY
jgi:hypothetical protein